MLNGFLSFLPSFWAADLILFFTTGAPISLGPFLSSFALVAFTVVVLFLGYTAVGRFYSLEPPHSAVAKIRDETIFSRILIRILPKGYKFVVISQIKDFLRRMANLAKLGYALAISIVIAFVQTYYRVIV